MRDGPLIFWVLTQYRLETLCWSTIPVIVFGSYWSGMQKTRGPSLRSRIVDLEEISGIYYKLRKSVVEPDEYIQFLADPIIENGVFHIQALSASVTTHIAQKMHIETDLLSATITAHIYITPLSAEKNAFAFKLNWGLETEGWLDFLAILLLTLLLNTLLSLMLMPFGGIGILSAIGAAVTSSVAVNVAKDKIENMLRIKH